MINNEQQNISNSLQQLNEEIELKLCLDDDVLSHLYEWLSRNACFLGKVMQTDYYFNNPNQSWFKTHPEGYKYALKYLRIRLTDKGDYICYKDWNQCSGSEVTYCKDIESPITNPEKHIQIIEQLGYTEKTIIHKLRESYRYDDLQIDIDKVNALGTFVEFEIKKRKYKNAEDEYQRIIDFIKQIGISHFRIQKQGFVILAWNPGFDFDALTALNKSELV